MCGGKVFCTWFGAGQGYPNPRSETITSANMVGWMPFREESLAHTITAATGQNRSGQSWEQAFGLMTAEEEARQQNFRWGAT